MGFSTNRFSFHRITYVFYEQYLTITTVGIINLALCLVPTFAVCYILLGLDLRSAFINLLTIIMIIVDTVGAMNLWGISYNAVSLINLVTVSPSFLGMIILAVCGGREQAPTACWDQSCQMCLALKISSLHWLCLVLFWSILFQGSHWRFLEVKDITGKRTFACRGRNQPHKNEMRIEAASVFPQTYEICRMVPFKNSL